jgi:plastocyanin
VKRLLLVLAIAAPAAAGCGSGGGGGSAPTPATGANNLQISADPSALKFNTKNLSATAGKVTITMTNQSALSHNVAIKGGVDVKGATVGQGATSVATGDLKPGLYTFYCSVDGHEFAGMNGTLTVK